MDHIDRLLRDEFRGLDSKPADDAPRAKKQAYSQHVSESIARAFAAEFRYRGLEGTSPGPPDASGSVGAERRMSGGIGAKKVDITWSTEESGLLLGISIKTINFRDRRSGNFQKNLTNRRGDLLFESVTLHRRFPYAVLGGFLFLDRGAATDDTDLRHSTFYNAHSRLRMFTGRSDPGGREEQYERLFIVLLDADPDAPWYEVYRVGNLDQPIPLQQAFDALIDIVIERNSDFYELTESGVNKL